MPWACRWRTTNVCDAWPVRCQTYGNLPSHKASPPTAWCQMTLLGDKGICVSNLSRVALDSRAAGIWTSNSWSQFQHPTNNSSTLPICHRATSGMRRVWELTAHTHVADCQKESHRSWGHHSPLDKKSKVCHTPTGYRREAHLPF